MSRFFLSQEWRRPGINPKKAQQAIIWRCSAGHEQPVPGTRLSQEDKRCRRCGCEIRKSVVSDKK